MLLLLIACAPEPPHVETCCTIQAVDIAPAPRPAPDPAPTTTPAPEPPPPCEPISGQMCTWMGVEGVALYTPEGVLRRETHLYLPLDLTWGPDGAPYVIDWNNHRIRTVDLDDTVRTLVGTGVIGDGYFDKDTGLWSDGPGFGYKINHPTHLSFDPADPEWMYIAAWHNSRIVRYSFETLEVEYFAGNATRTFTGDGGPAAVAGFDLPSSAVFDGLGNAYVSDQSNQIIRRIDAAGVVTTVAGVLKTPGYNGDGLPPLETTLAGEIGNAVDPSGRLTWFAGRAYFPDTDSHILRAFDPAAETIERIAGVFVPNPIYIDLNGDGAVELAKGLGAYAGDGGPAIDASLNNPRDIAIADDGTMYVADTANHCIRVITPDGLIDTFAGVCGIPGIAVPGEPSLAENLPAREALLYKPFGVALDAAGNVYIADTYNHVIRVVWR